MKQLSVFAVLMMVSCLAGAKIKSGAYPYKHGGLEFEGYLAEPQGKSAKKLPGILMIHQWKGVSDHERQRADALATEGYVVLVADVYGKGVRPQAAEEAGKQAGLYKGNRTLFRERLRAAFEELSKLKNVDNQKIVGMGYCFGGTGALELARSGAPVVGTASFHGGLDSLNPADAKNIKGSVVIYHGAIDPYVPAKDIEAFNKELNDAKVDYQFISYSNAVHSFTDKGAGQDISKGAAYNEQADKRSWQSFLSFLKEVTLK